MKIAMICSLFVSAFLFSCSSGGDSKTVTGQLQASYINGASVCVDDTIGTSAESCATTTGQGNFTLQNALSKKLTVRIANVAVGSVTVDKAGDGFIITPAILAADDLVKAEKITALFHLAGTTSDNLTYDLSNIKQTDIKASEVNDYLAGKISTIMVGIKEIDHTKEGSGPQIGMVTTTEAQVSWDTHSLSEGALKYWVAGESNSKDKVQSGKATKRHSVKLTKLKPDTKYEIEVEGRPAMVGSFRTAPTENKPFVFVSMADNRGPSDKDDIKGLPQSFINIVNDAAKRNPAFAVNAGDLFYGKNSDKDIFKQLYQSFKKAIQPLASKTPYLISPGNHEMSPFKSNYDIMGFDPVLLFNEEFQQPGPLKDYEGFVYSWDWGKAHFVSIATNRFEWWALPPHHGMYRISDAQIAWLDEDLQKAKSKGAQFIIVFGHSNAFSKSSYPDQELADLNNTDPDQRDKFWKVLVKHKADIYVCGHRHFSDVSTHDGVVQWMNGNSGSVASDKADANQYTVWTVDVDGGTITAELVDESGNTGKTEIFKKK